MNRLWSCFWILTVLVSVCQLGSLKCTTTLMALGFFKWRMLNGSTWPVRYPHFSFPPYIQPVVCPPPHMVHLQLFHPSLTSISVILWEFLHMLYYHEHTLLSPLHTRLNLSRASFLFLHLMISYCHFKAKICELRNAFLFIIRFLCRI